MNVKIRRQIQPRGGLWFISELLQKILAIAAMCFSGEKKKTWNLWNLSWGIIGAIVR